MPDVGEMVDTPNGKAKVIGMNILDLVVQVKYKDDYIQEYHYDELEEMASGGGVS